MEGAGGVRALRARAWKVGTLRMEACMGFCMLSYPSQNPLSFGIPPPLIGREAGEADNEDVGGEEVRK